MVTTGRRVVGALVGLLILQSGCATSQNAGFVPPADRSEGISDEPETLFREARGHYEATGSHDLLSLDAVAARLEKGLALSTSPGVDERVLLARVYLEMIEVMEVSSQREAYADKVILLGAGMQADDAARVEGAYYQALGMARRLDANRALGEIKPMMAMAQIAVEIDPAYDAAGALSLMGKIYLEAPPWPASVGDEDEAVEVLGRAVSLAPTPLNRLFLGQALYHAEEPTQAAVELRRAYEEGKAEGLPERWLKECEEYLAHVGEEP